MIGDSACALRSHLITPHDNAKPLSDEDNFNFFLSSKRIHVECAFGEIDRRWGILWRSLEGDLSSHQCTIDSCPHLHNSMVDHRLQNKDDLPHNGDNEREELDVQSKDFCVQSPMKTVGTASAENNGRRGRPNTFEAMEREKGKQVRD